MVIQIRTKENAPLEVEGVDLEDEVHLLVHKRLVLVLGELLVHARNVRAHLVLNRSGNALPFLCLGGRGADRLRALRDLREGRVERVGSDADFFRLHRLFKFRLAVWILLDLSLAASSGRGTAHGTAHLLQKFHA